MNRLFFSIIAENHANRPNKPRTELLHTIRYFARWRGIRDQKVRVVRNLNMNTGSPYLVFRSARSFSGTYINRYVLILWLRVWSFFCKITYYIGLIAPSLQASLNKERAHYAFVRDWRADRMGASGKCVTVTCDRWRSDPRFTVLQRGGGTQP